MSRRTQRRATYASGFAAAVLVLAACGGGETSDTSATPAPDTTATTTAPDSGAGTNAPVDSVEPQLGGTSWNVTMYNLDTGGMTNLWPGTEITLRFEDDGTVSGIGGCNNYSGTFEVEGPYDEFVEGALDENDGQAIHMGPFTVTEMACTSPNNVMEQETEYLDALQKAGRWLVARGNLILRTGDGFFLIEAEPDE